MNNQNYIKTTVFLVILTFFYTISAFAQTGNFPAPRQEKLLNGLKLLIWNEPQADKVSVKIRVHSGAAFDPKDKMGTMALLSDILFPTEGAKEFFADDLGGSLDIATNYDYIQISASGTPDKIQSILETLATAVTNPQITQENLEIVRKARLDKIKDLEKNPTYVADTAVAKRLFGEFPYGRSIEGTTESLAKIDRADLLHARDRFFTADNTTITINGNIKPDFVYRASRQLFGAWRKSDGKIASTFRQPDAPNTEALNIANSYVENNVVRFALRSPARNAKDYAAYLVLAKVLQSRITEFPNSFVRNEPHFLRGTMVVGFSAQKGGNEGFSKEKTKDQIKTDEFEKAKQAVASEMAQKSVADHWLDVDTYRLVSVKDEMQKVNNLTLSDANQALANFQKEPYVIVLLSKSDASATKN